MMFVPLIAAILVAAALAVLFLFAVNGFRGRDRKVFARCDAGRDDVVVLIAVW
jgi:hypothetical protein